VLAAAPEPVKIYWAAAVPEMWWVAAPKMWWVAAPELESCMMFSWWLQRSAAAQIRPPAIAPYSRRLRRRWRRPGRLPPTDSYWWTSSLGGVE
jgi:hypothetical protein